MRPYILLQLIFIFLISAANAQHAFEPEHLGDSINSPYPEMNPIISMDGKILYFSRANHPENAFGAKNTQDIWYAFLNEDGSWAKARRMPLPFNSIRYNNLLGLSADGNSFYISGLFYKDLTWKKRGISKIVRYTDGTFSKPEKVKIGNYSRKNRGKFTSVYINNEENLMLLSFSRRWNGKKNKLYVSTRKRNGNWKSPKKIKGKIKSSAMEFSPSLSVDGRTLYFSRLKKKELNLYKAEIKPDKKGRVSYRSWHEPVKMNDTINQGRWQSFYSLNSKGSYAYYASVAGSKGSSDILRLKVFEENPFVLLRGKVLNKKNNAPLIGKKLHFLVNEKEVDFAYDTLSGSYELLLPLGEKYEIAVATENWEPQPYLLDASGFYEYTEMDKDLYLKPLPYVLVTGKFISSDSVSIISSDSLEVLVNGLRPDSVIIDPSGYQLKIHHGSSYILQAKSSGYKSEQVRLDLRDIDEYTTISKDIQLHKLAPVITSAIIKGKILNSVTQKGIDSNVKVTILPDGFPSLSVQIKDSMYTMKLPLGKAHTIYAIAEDFYPVTYSVNLSVKNVKEVYKDLYITPLQIGQAIKLDHIFFQSGKAVLKQESFEELDKVYRLLKENPKMKVEISGHTDNVGKAEFNKSLSQERANSVLEYLANKGIARSRIIPVGYGMEFPVSSNETEEGRRQNRRVEFKILEK
ncbi:MAG: OmpA family protein [Cytophagaceae bacterium]